MPTTPAPAALTEEMANLLVDGIANLYARRAQATKVSKAKSRPENKRASVSTKRVATPAH